MDTKLLGISDLRAIYGMGRDLATAITQHRRMPSLRVGRRYKVQRTDIDKLIKWAAKNKIDLWDWARGEIDESPFDEEES